jgi:hypothetical protein
MEELSALVPEAIATSGKQARASSDSNWRSELTVPPARQLSVLAWAVLWREAESANGQPHQATQSTTQHGAGPHLSQADGSGCCSTAEAGSDPSVIESPTTRANSFRDFTANTFILALLL